MSTGGDLDVFMQVGKRKRAHSVMAKEFEAVNLGVKSQGGFNIYGKYGGTHKFTCCNFKCYKCGEKRHVVRCVSTVTGRVMSNPTILHGLRRGCKPKHPSSYGRSRLNYKKS